MNGIENSPHRHGIVHGFAHSGMGVWSFPEIIIAEILAEKSSHGSIGDYRNGMGYETDVLQHGMHILSRRVNFSTVA
jgi:hypothetical protein